MPPSPPIPVIFGLCSFFCIFLGYASLMRRVLNSHIIPIFLVSCFVVVSYFAFLLGIYPIVLPMIKICGLLLFVAALLPWKPVFRAKSITLESRNDSFLSRLDALFRPTSFFWIGAFIVSALIIRYDIMPENKDDFNHWTVYAKWILLNQQLPSTAGVTSYLAYVPGISIAKAFFASFFPDSCNLFSVFLAAHYTFLWAILTSLIPSFPRETWRNTLSLSCFIALETLLLSEGAILPKGLEEIRNGVLLLAVLAAVLLFSAIKCAKARKIHLGACLLYAIFYFLLILKGSVGETTIDYCIGFLFASLCLTYFMHVRVLLQMKDLHRLKGFLILLPILGFFILLKNNCIIFAVFFCLLVFFDSILSAFSVKRSAKQRLVLVLLPFAIMIFGTLLFHYSWRAGYLSRLEKADEQQFESARANLSISKIYKTLTDKSDVKTASFIQEFLVGAKKAPILGSSTQKDVSLVSTLALMILSFGSSLIILLSSPKRHVGKNLIFFSVLSVCFFLNFVFLLVSFIFFFNYGFNLTGGAAIRYATHFIYPWILTVCAVSCFYFAKSGKPIRPFVFIFIPILFCFWLPAFSKSDSGSNINRKKLSLARFEKDLAFSHIIHDSIMRDLQLAPTKAFASHRRRIPPDSPLYRVIRINDPQSKSARYYYERCIVYFAVDDHGNFSRTSSKTFSQFLKNKYDYLVYDYLLSLQDKSTEKAFLEMAKDYLPPDYKGGTCLFRIEKTAKPKPNGKPFRLVPVPVPQSLP